MDGSIAGFPDDDCEYQPDTLEKVVKFFKENEDKRIYSCRTLERGKDYGTGIMSEQNLKLTKGNIEKTVKSITFFVNYVFEDIILFDENLGVGSAFGSGEETDYVLTLLHKGYKGEYFQMTLFFILLKKGIMMTWTKLINMHSVTELSLRKRLWEEKISFIISNI